MASKGGDAASSSHSHQEDEEIDLKNKFDLYMKALQDPDHKLQEIALQNIRQLTADCTRVYKERKIKGDPIEDLTALVRQIVAFYMKHNSEYEAVDLSVEVEDPTLLDDHLNDFNFRRVCLYMSSLARLSPKPVDLLFAAYNAYMKYREYPSALQIALFLRWKEFAKEVFTYCDDFNLQKQLCFILARHGFMLELTDEVVADTEDRLFLQAIVKNSRLSEGYLYCAREMDVLKPVAPRDIFKAHPIDRTGLNDYSDLYNIATTYVNAFINAGFHEDTIVTLASQASGCHFSPAVLNVNEGNGLGIAAASLGMIFLWNNDLGIQEIKRYFECNDNNIIGGALLGVGICSCRVATNYDDACSLLKKYTGNDNPSIHIGLFMGIGLAYVGTEDRYPMIYNFLACVLQDVAAPLHIIAFCAISMGLIYIGSCEADVASLIFIALKSRHESDLQKPIARFLPLALGLLYLGKKELVDIFLKRLDAKLKKYCEIIIKSFAYAGTGDVLMVKKLLGHCTQHLENGETDPGFAVLGISMVAMAEETGIEMAIRLLGHLSQRGEQNVRRAVPLALGLLCVSNPKVDVIDTLSRLSQDTYPEVAMAAVISLGLVGAGTKNGRIANILRNLSRFYNKDANLLFFVRIALGLLNLGKGLLTLSPLHSDRFLLSPTALAGLVITLQSFLEFDSETLLLGGYHYILYYLVLAMQPRTLITVDENLRPLSIPVRVGRAVEASQPGRPETITSSRTQSTPVVLDAGDRAELATEKYIPLSPSLEGIVILREITDK